MSRISLEVSECGYKTGITLSGRLTLEASWPQTEFPAPLPIILIGKRVCTDIYRSLKNPFPIRYAACTIPPNNFNITHITLNKKRNKHTHTTRDIQPAVFTSYATLTYTRL